MTLLGRILARKATTRVVPGAALPGAIGPRLKLRRRRVKLPRKA